MKISLGLVLSKLQEYKRIVKVAKKPTKEEFRTIVKVSGLGILVIGALGFFVQFISNLVKGI